MPAWIFQGNPDYFRIDDYLSTTRDIVWMVKQKHFAKLMRPGDDFFLWRAQGRSKLPAGVVAYGHLSSTPEIMDEDEAAKSLWVDSIPVPALRVRARIERLALGSREVVQRNWILQDPILSELRILKMPAETNYPITGGEASRLKSLIYNTGRDWNRDESLAGLWAYTATRDGAVSRVAGSPVADVSLRIGRAVTGVYNKVMNFRSLDPTDSRTGLPGVSKTDRAIWAEFYVSERETLDSEAVEKEYRRVWGATSLPYATPAAVFSDVPNDDLSELQQFAARVRRGQLAFRANLLKAYGERCAITGWGPAEVLEAVHIVPHATSGINEMDNGLLLRADLHHLLDGGQLRIDHTTMRVLLNPSLEGTQYWDLQGVELRPRVDGSQIHSRYIEERWSQITA